MGTCSICGRDIDFDSEAHDNWTVDIDEYVYCNEHSPTPTPNDDPALEGHPTELAERLQTTT